MREVNREKLKSALQYIDLWLEFNFENGDLPGLQVAVQHGDDLLYSRAFGFANVEKKEKLTKDHLFRVASHSKTFTATAIMQLYEAGKLTLDDPVSKYVLWFKSAKDQRIAKITIRQLLYHSAGLIGNGIDGDYWSLTRDFPDIDELKQYIKAAQLYFDPDEVYKYSNFGYSYLGQVIEAVSGMSFVDYTNKYIIKLLDLKNTGPEITDGVVKNLATGYGAKLYGRPRLPRKHVATNAMAAATGFYSTAEDLCRYFAAHFYGNETLLTDISKRTMQHGAWESQKSIEYYGLGLVQPVNNDWKLHGHSGGFPGFVTRTLFDPEQKLVISVLGNCLGSPSSDITDKMYSIIKTFHEEAELKVADNKKLEKFTGRFYDKWGPNDIVLAGEQLLIITPKDWNDFTDCYRLELIDNKTLKIVQTNAHSSDLGETIDYEFDASGKVKSIRSAGIRLLTFEQAKEAGWF